MRMTFKSFMLACCAAALVLYSGHANSQQTPTTGEITIPYKDYLQMKEAVEAKEKNRYWDMTYQQILEKKGGDQDQAWKIYDYWVLRNLYVNGTITSAWDTIADIHILNEIDPSLPITININSGGGSIFGALNLYNAMMSSPSPIYTVCDSIALSAAAVLFAAGDVRVAEPGCSWMIHEVAVGANDGQTTQHIKWAETVIDVERMLVDILSDHTGLSVQDVHAISEFESFYSGEELLELGVADMLRTSPVVDRRELPDHLLPKNRMKKNFEDKLNAK